MNSASHRANILSTNFGAMGIGCFTQNGVTYWVQLFSGASGESSHQSGVRTETRSINIDNNVTHLNLEFNINDSLPSTLDAGYSTTLRVEARNTGELNGWRPVVTFDADSFDWSSSNDFVVNVDNGRIEAQGNEGSATVTARSWAGDFVCSRTFAGKAKVSHDLARATIEVNENPSYDGSPQEPGVTVRYDGRTLSSGTDYYVTYSNNVNVGDATVTAHGRGDYTGEVSTTFYIHQVSVSSLDISRPDPQPYTGRALKPAVSVKFHGKELTKGVDYDLSYYNNVNAGEGHYVITGKGNFAYSSYDKIFQITPADISGASVSTIGSQTYTGKEIKPAVTVRLGGKTLVSGSHLTSRVR